MFLCTATWSTVTVLDTVCASQLLMLLSSYDSGLELECISLLLHYFCNLFKFTNYLIKYAQYKMSQEEMDSTQ